MFLLLVFLRASYVAKRLLANDAFIDCFSWHSQYCGKLALCDDPSGRLTYLWTYRAGGIICQELSFQPGLTNESSSEFNFLNSRGLTASRVTRDDILSPMLLGLNLAFIQAAPDSKSTNLHGRGHSHHLIFLGFFIQLTSSGFCELPLSL
ncbi:unnamed protein product [Protopolystoma xenopodis]|uniref:Uncharacterized protein n=1 Tax=Protopolystoma xenopodis TaxID=117903 RepID=A0A448WYF7_9PLAT|nr:unnamed protein product [Protopolystoma xenopodis]